MTALRAALLVEGDRVVRPTFRAVVRSVLPVQVATQKPGEDPQPTGEVAIIVTYRDGRRSVWNAKRPIEVETA